MIVTLRGRFASGVPVFPIDGTSCGVTCALAPLLSNGDGAGAACCAVTDVPAADCLRQEHSFSAPFFPYAR